MATRITVHPLSTADQVASQVPLDSALATRLRRSFELLVPNADQMAERFYSSLFAAHPQLRQMFPNELAGQRKKLIDTLQWIATHLDQTESLHCTIAALGERHVGYGAKPEHFGPVVQELLRAMTDAAGPAWTASDHDDWRLALVLISERMTKP